MSYTTIDLANWHRKEQYEFFMTYDEPFTGLAVEVNVSQAYQRSKETSTSFFKVYLFKCMKAVNKTKAFRLRIVEGEVRDYQTIHSSAVIMRPDQSFGFSHIPFDHSFEVFSDNVEAEKKRIYKDRSLLPPVNAPNVIHFSAMPWIKFTGLSHARKYNNGDSSPKITCGKIFEKEGKRWMPVSIHVHHALADGRDMAEFIDYFQDELNREWV